MMKLTLLTALIAVVSARSSYKCSPSGICYFVNDDQLRNYEESRAYCKEFDGQLPQLKSHLEQVWFSQNFLEPDQSIVWLGIRRHETHDVFENGDVVNFSDQEDHKGRFAKGCDDICCGVFALPRSGVKVTKACAGLGSKTVCEV